MKLEMMTPAAIVLRTLSQDDQQSVKAWLDRLLNWNTDEAARAYSHELHSSKNTYVLHATPELRIFFRLDGDSVSILDIAKKSTILMSGGLPEHGKV